VRKSLILALILALIVILVFILFPSEQVSYFSFSEKEQLWLKEAEVLLVDEDPGAMQGYFKLKFCQLEEKQAKVINQTDYSGPWFYWLKDWQLKEDGLLVSWKKDWKDIIFVAVMVFILTYIFSYRFPPLFKR